MIALDILEEVTDALDAVGMDEDGFFEDEAVRLIYEKSRTLLREEGR